MIEPSEAAGRAAVSRRRHFAAVFFICAAAAVLYAGVTRSYFCSYDDFVEMHRAAFEDTEDPSRVFTTSHFNSPKYRPLNRLIVLWTYQASAGDPLYFRVRNAAFHLVNAALVYALGWLLFRSAAVSAAAAALFALHPLVNQAVIGAVWTNTIAHTGFLLALVLFIVAVQAKRWALWLPLALVTGWLALLTYDSNIVVFPLMALYGAFYLPVFRGRILSPRFLAAFAAIAGGLIAAYFALRMIFISDAWSQAATTIPAAPTVAKNIFIYLFALLSPLDPVFANEWLKAPFPSEAGLNGSTVALFAVPAALLGLALAALVFRALKRDPAWLRKIDWSAAGFLASGIVLPLSPVLLLQSHPSETYLYLSVAFYCLLLAYTARRLLDAAAPAGGAKVFAIVTVSFLAVYAAATATRNARVARCAATANQIVRALPPELARGGWTVYIAAAPEPRASAPYGFYAYRGIQTIGLDGEALTAALQLLYRNPALAGALVAPEDLPARCRGAAPARRMCLLVYPDGRVEALGARIPAGPAGSAPAAHKISARAFFPDNRIPQEEPT